MQFFVSWLTFLLLATIGICSRDDAWDKADFSGNERSWSKARADTKYIVVLKPNSGGLLGSIIGSILPKTLDTLAQFTLGAFSGFNAELTQDQLDRLRKNPNVGRMYDKIDSTLMSNSGRIC